MTELEADRMYKMLVDAIDEAMHGIKAAMAELPLSAPDGLHREWKEMNDRLERLRYDAWSLIGD